MSRAHELKTWPEPFAALKDGSKRFELRRDDRGYAVGDLLVLREWDPALEWPASERPLAKGGYVSGSEPLRFRVTYVLHGGRFGLPPEICVMSIEPEPDKKDGA